MKTEGKRRLDQISSKISSDDDGGTRKKKKDESFMGEDAVEVVGTTGIGIDEGMAPESDECFCANQYYCHYCDKTHTWETTKVNRYSRKKEPKSGLPDCVRVSSKERNGDCFYLTMVTFAKAVGFKFPGHRATNERQKALALRKVTSKHISYEMYEHWMRGQLVALTEEWGIEYAVGVNCVLAYTKEDGDYSGPNSDSTKTRLGDLASPEFTEEEEKLVCGLLDIHTMTQITNDDVREFCMIKILSASKQDPPQSPSAVEEIKSLSFENFVRWVSIQPSNARKCTLMEFYYWGDEMALEIASETLGIGFEVIDPCREKSPLLRSQIINPTRAEKFGTVALKELRGGALHYEPVRYLETERGYVYNQKTEFLEWAYKCESAAR